MWGAKDRQCWHKKSKLHGDHFLSVTCWKLVSYIMYRIRCSLPESVFQVSWENALSKTCQWQHGQLDERFFTLRTLRDSLQFCSHIGCWHSTREKTRFWHQDNLNRVVEWKHSNTQNAYSSKSHLSWDGLPLVVYEDNTNFKGLK